MYAQIARMSPEHRAQVLDEGAGIRRAFGAVPRDK